MIAARRARDFDNALLKARPSLLSFAMKFTMNRAAAEDLVQETMCRALHKYESFEAGTNLKAWLFTILRNEFFTKARKKYREVEDPDGIVASLVGAKPAQEFAYDLQIVMGRMEALNVQQRICLELVAMDGETYDVVADYLGIPVGTVKSAVSRARATLAGHHDGYERDDR